MSKDFDSTLADAIELAAHSAQLPGPSAARIRGRQRTMYKRIAVSTASLALVAVGTTTGFVLAGSNGGGSKAPVVPLASQSVSAQPSATGASSGAASTPASRTPSTSGTSAGSTSPSAGLNAAPDPGTYVAGAWLPAGSMPFSPNTGGGAAVAWQVSSNLAGNRVGGNVFEAADATTAETLPLGTSLEQCSLPGFAGGLKGTQFDAFTGPNSGAQLNSTAIAADAGQGIFFFNSPHAASVAWNTISAAYTACATTESGTNPTTGLAMYGFVSRISQASTGPFQAQCWTNLQSATNSAAGQGTVKATCFVEYGSLVGWVGVQVNEATTSGVDFTAAMQSPQQSLENLISVYRQ